MRGDPTQDGLMAVNPIGRRRGRVRLPIVPRRTVPLHPTDRPTSDPVPRIVS